MKSIGLEIKNCRVVIEKLIGLDYNDEEENVYRLSLNQ